MSNFWLYVEVFFLFVSQNVNDSNLRQLYIRAYNSRDSKLDTISGLTKAVKGHYGFFVSATLARRALRSTLIQERCALKELPLPQTFTMVALPMANSCPYKKIINLKYVPEKIYYITETKCSDLSAVYAKWYVFPVFWKYANEAFWTE